MANLSNINNKFVLTTDGAVLINQGSVDYGTAKLQVSGNGSTGTITWRNDGGRKTGYLYSDSNGIAIYSTALNNAGIYLADNLRIDFRVNGSEKMRITSGARINMDVMAGQASEGVIRIGRYDVNTTRYNEIQNSVTSTGAGSYMNLSVHSGTENVVTDVMTLLGDGNVGIGVSPITSPNSADKSLSIYSGQDCSIILKDNVETWEIYQNDDLQFSFGTTPTTVMTMQRTTGNVGIGTVSPTRRFQVSGSIATNVTENVCRIEGGTWINSGGITIESTGANSASGRVTTIYSIDNQDQASPLAFGTGTTEIMRIENGGNIKVNFNESGSYGNLYFQDVDNGASMFYIQPAEYKGSTPYNTNYLNAANSSNIGFIAGGSERMRITSAGNVGIGDTSAPNKLSVKDTTGNLTCRFSASSGVFSLYQNNTDGTVIFSANHGNTGSENRFIWQSAGAVEQMRLFDQGRLHPIGGIFLGNSNNSNLLNYYASGTWTPTVTTSQLTSPTITSSSGRWQRVGKVVTASFEFTMSNPTVGAGSVIISNLPIAIADTDHVSGCGVIGDLGKTINVRHYTATNQIAMNFYDGNYCGTAFRTVGTVTYWAAT